MNKAIKTAFINDSLNNGEYRTPGSGQWFTAGEAQLWLCRNESAYLRRYFAGEIHRRW
jgi:hypothetical protein